MRLDDGLAAYVDSTWGTENTLARGDNQDRYNVDRRSGYHEVGGMYASLCVSCRCSLISFIPTTESVSCA